MKTPDTLIRKTWPRIRFIAKPTKGPPFYQIDARRKGTNGGQHARPTKEAAEALAAEIAKDFNREGREGLEISSELRVFAIKADAILKPYGKSILQAAEFYKTHLDSILTTANSRIVGELADEWYSDKESGRKRKLREHTLKGIYKGKEFLKKHFGDRRILEVGKKDLEAIFDGMQIALISKRNLNSLVSQFFNWGIAKEYCVANPTDKIEFIPEPKEGVEILTPDKARLFMTTCETKFPTLTLYHAISLFAGLRPFECQRLTWEDIYTEQGYIHIRPEITKVKEERTVPINQTLAEWLKAYDGERKGFITTPVNFQNLIKQCRAAFGYKMVLYRTKQKNSKITTTAETVNPSGGEYNQDVTRHSYASYWLPLHQEQAGELFRRLWALRWI